MGVYVLLEWENAIDIYCHDVSSDYSRGVWTDNRIYWTLLTVNHNLL
jgi:hypothetical protein